jgi:DNA-binding transcriptional ArsR family regulator
VTGAIEPEQSQQSELDRLLTEPVKDSGPAGGRQVQAKAKARARRVGRPPPAGRAPGPIRTEPYALPSSFELARDLRATSSEDALPATAALPSRGHRNSIEIRQLRYFVAAVEAGSLRSAESRSGVSQPAMTRQIHQLEEELGVELLVRKSRGIRPTDAGRVLFEDAVRILAMLERALQRTRTPGLHVNEPPSTSGETTPATPCSDGSRSRVRR